MPDATQRLVHAWRAVSMFPLLRPWTERRVERQWIAAGRTPPPPPIVKQLIVKRHQARHGLTTLVETGTFTGEMVAATLTSFRRIFTIELDPVLADAARRRFVRAPHVSVVEGDSAVAFAEVIGALTEPALCWLDAHYTIEGTADSGTVPLMDELSAVAASVVRGHVVLIDDARCFDGREGFPAIGEVEAFCAAHGGRFEIADDIIRWYS